MSLEGKYIDGEMIKIGRECELPQFDSTGEEVGCGEQASFMYKFDDGNIWYLCEKCAEKMTESLPKGDVPYEPV